MPKLLSEIINQNRAERTLGKLLTRDQEYYKNPELNKPISPGGRTRREALFDRTARVYNKPGNLETLVQNPKTKHPTWAIGQHLDDHPKTQQRVHDVLKANDPKDLRVKFARERIAVNKNLSSDGSGQPLKDARPYRPRDVYDPPKSAKEALAREKELGNTRLVNAINKADRERSLYDKAMSRFSQPSFAVNMDNNPLDTPLAKAGKVVSKIARVTGPAATAAGVADTAKDIAFSTPQTRQIGHDIYKNVPGAAAVSDAALKARESLGIPSTAPKEFQRKTNQ